MRILNALSVRLINLSLTIRLSVVVMAFLLCCVLYLFSPFNGPLFALPVALVVWFFKRRGAILGVGFTVVMLLVSSMITTGGPFAPRAPLTGILTGTIALSTEGFFISYLRYLLDLAEAARLQAEEAEQQRRIAYEQRIEALQAEQRMAAAYEQQLHLNQLKDEFILHVNHELRNPLTALHGWLETINFHYAQLDSATLTRYLHRAKESSEVLIHLVNSVLTTTQTSDHAQACEFEICEIAQIVHEELEQLDPHEAADHLIQIDVPEELKILANQQYVRQILRNMLSNALKYSPKQTHILISASLQNTQPGVDLAPRVSISVQDAGPGIPLAEQPLLFEKFVRLKRDLAGSVPGCGLGLYISRQLVEAMGGHIWVESSGQAGEGSRFCFALPGAALSL